MVLGLRASAALYIRVKELGLDAGMRKGCKAQPWLLQEQEGCCVNVYTASQD